MPQLPSTMNGPLTPEKIDEFKQKTVGGFVPKSMFNHVQTDDEGAYSFSFAENSRYMCRFVYAHFKHLEKKQLIITDAGAGAGGDSMQFVAAVKDERKHRQQSDHMFEHVNSIEINESRQKMLNANLTYVHENVCHRDSNKPTFQCVRGNYKEYVDIMHQDIVYIDPPWYGASGDESKSRELCLLDEEVECDGELSVLNIIKRLKKKNKDTEHNKDIIQTRCLVVKTPSNWHPQSLATICKAAEGWVRKVLFKYDFWMFYLCEGDYEYAKYVPDIFKNIQGFQSWRSQQQQLKLFFPKFGEDNEYDISDKQPMFLQNIWEDQPTDEGRNNEELKKWELDRLKKERNSLPAESNKSDVSTLNVLNGTVSDDPNPNDTISDVGVQTLPSATNTASVKTLNFNQKRSSETEHHYAWRTCCVNPYVAGSLHSNYNMHNGEKKLLESSMYTMLYGLMRIKRASKGKSWDHVLKNTVVLYVGAAGQNKENHHFNELLKAIPHVHFACYDIRAIESTLDETIKNERMTVFHKIFTKNDLDRWTRFCNDNPSKALIFISDIRSDWSQALMDMEASKDVTRMKIKQMQCYAQEGQSYKKKEAHNEIHTLLAANEVISESVDRHIEIDNFVQWSWFQNMSNGAKNIAIFSAKTREPYMRTNKKRQTYHHFPGAELFQSATRSSTETRTQVTPIDFQLKDSKPNDKSMKKCIQSFFGQSYGDKKSFMTEYIDYGLEYQSRVDQNELWNTLPKRSVALHDMKFAWYNSDFPQTKHKGASDKGIRMMYSEWRKSYIEDSTLCTCTCDALQQTVRSGYSSDTHANLAMKQREENTTDIEDFCKRIDAKMKAGRDAFDENKKYDNKKHCVNLDEAGRGTKEDLDREIELWVGKMHRTRMSKATIMRTHMWFEVWAAMRRYQQILENSNSNSLWGVSTLALSTLLVLNMSINSKSKSSVVFKKIKGIQSIKHTVENYDVDALAKYKMKSSIDAVKRFKKEQLIRLNLKEMVRNAHDTHHKDHDELQQSHLKQQQKTKDAKIIANKYKSEYKLHMEKNRMSNNHVQTQLYFNLINPYALRLYTELATALDGRYNSIRQCLDSISKSGSVLQQLEFNPGSAHAHSRGNAWLEARLQAYGEFDIDKLRVSRDWYCYWLKPLLDDVNGQGLKHSVSVHDIISTVSPYMKTDEGEDGTLKYSLWNDLQFHKWPLSKPVLFFACESGSIPMIDFCMTGRSVEEKTEYVNTARYRVMRCKTDKNSKITSKLMPENYPLHVAAYWGHCATVVHLKKLLADQTLVNHWLETPYLCAEEGLREAKFSLETWDDDEYDNSQIKQLAKKRIENRLEGCAACMKEFSKATNAERLRSKLSRNAAQDQRDTILEIDVEQ